MSVSPLQNFWKPPPVPEVPTVTRTLGFSSWKNSAAASLRGATVLDPSILMVPLRLPGVSPVVLPVPSSPPQAVAARARVATQARSLIPREMRPDTGSSVSGPSGKLTRAVTVGTADDSNPSGR